MAKVDVITRRKYARLLRSFVTGRITNFEYENLVNENVDFKTDRAIGAVYRQAWNLYDDIHEERMDASGELNKAGHREIAKWLLFLYTDLEYRWPSFKQRLSSVLFNLSGGMIGTRLDHESGEAELWPFFSSNEFRAAVNKPLHFIGPSNLSGLADHRTRLSRLLPYPVIWKTAFYMMIGGGFVYLEWRESHFNWALLPGLMCCAGFMTVVLSLHAKKKSSNLTWWQAVIILLAIFLSPFAAVLLAKYLTK